MFFSRLKQNKEKNKLKYHYRQNRYNFHYTLFKFRVKHDEDQFLVEMNNHSNQVDRTFCSR